ncbi:hypothetical protein [Acidisphaera sp. S103]|uniref:hypothetical protein n=1 Tax=Acidisphaera sp. S103 TaxID=1747223 RepID=UPI00131E0701|nr:hypothetical protein [Acidisphaera sp. S103]
MHLVIGASPFHTIGASPFPNIGASPVLSVRRERTAPEEARLPDTVMAGAGPPSTPFPGSAWEGVRRERTAPEEARLPDTVMAGAGPPSTPFPRSIWEGVVGGPAPTMATRGRCRMLVDSDISRRTLNIGASPFQNTSASPLPQTEKAERGNT